MEDEQHPPMVVETEAKPCEDDDNDNKKQEGDDAQIETPSESEKEKEKQEEGSTESGLNKLGTTQEADEQNDPTIKTQQEQDQNDD